MKILITGMSGTGKSTLLAGLAACGVATVDTDYGAWTDGRGRWDETLMTGLLESPGDLVVSGTVENQGSFRRFFDHVILLSAPLSVMLERVADRDNPYGRTTADRTRIARHLAEVEPLLRAGADLELDGTLPREELVRRVKDLLERG